MLKGLFSVWSAIDLVIALRALAFSMEVIQGRARRSDLFQWTALAVYGCYVYTSQSWRYGFQGENPWQVFFLEAAFVIQVMADIRYYFLSGSKRNLSFQCLLWALNLVQMLCLVLRPWLLALAVCFFLVEVLWYRRRNHHQQLEG
jgi:hypothetical protein